MKMIDLRSDTVTKPSEGMMQAMMSAPVGDDVFSEDPSALELQAKMAALFGMEDALFFPSGVMCNQIAIKCHTSPMDEIICDKISHIYNSENGGWAMHSGVSIKLMDGDRGRFTAEQVKAGIQSNYDWTPKTSLVCIENTVNKGGGSIWDINEIKKIKTVCTEHNLKFHLDGARLFNALVETGEKPSDFGAIFDSISICFSKGLGTPVGSVLVGDKDTIIKARKWRKAFGGGMRQIGGLSAACIYALDHNVELLKEDHRRARAIGEVLLTKSFVKYLFPIESNIVLFEITDAYTNESFLDLLIKNEIIAVPFGPNTIRLVTHLDFDDKALEKILYTIKNL
jgi:threonine aldolase